MQRPISSDSGVIDVTSTSPLLIRTRSFANYCRDDEPDSTGTQGAAAKGEQPRSRLLDEILDRTGYGLFHVLLILVAGWALASDSVEVQCISFVAPVLEATNSTSQLKPTKLEIGMLDSVIFLGMLVGGYFWGVWSDLIGRRACLITSLSVNGLFGFASSLSPNFPVFLALRFGSGVGVGGSLPVAFSYLSEFFSKRFRDPFVIVLASFWITGQVFTAALALAVIPREISFYIGSLHIESWRVFIMLSTIPCVSSAILMLFMPESPSFLYDKKKYKRLMRILKAINTCSIYRKGKQFDSVQVMNEINCLDDELRVMEKNYDKPSKLELIKRGIKKFLSTTVSLFKPPHLRSNLVMIIVFVTLSFGYYGLSLWFPTYFKNIQTGHINCKNSSEPGYEKHCVFHLNDSSVYFDSLYVALSALPGTVVGVFVINIIGAKIMLAVSMVASALCTFLIWGVPPKEYIVVILSCLFSGISVAGWNALDVLSVSLFPVHVRSTAMGIQAAAGRIGAIAGTILFGQLTEVNLSLPIIVVSSSLTIGSLAVFLLPLNKKWIKRLQRVCPAQLMLCCCYGDGSKKPVVSTYSTDSIVNTNKT